MGSNERDRWMPAMARISAIHAITHPERQTMSRHRRVFIRSMAFGTFTVTSLGAQYVKVILSPAHGVPLDSSVVCKATGRLHHLLQRRLPVSKAKFFDIT